MLTSKRYTRQDKRHSVFTEFTPPAIVNITNQAMLVEQRMWLCVLLRGIAETDLSNIGNEGENGTKDERQGKKQRKVSDAIAWVGSADFEVVCSNAGVDPKYARLLSPEKAQRAYDAVMQGHTQVLLDEFTKESDSANRDADSN